VQLRQRDECRNQDVNLTGFHERTLVAQRDVHARQREDAVWLRNEHATHVPTGTPRWLRATYCLTRHVCSCHEPVRRGLCAAGIPSNSRTAASLPCPFEDAYMAASSRGFHQHAGRNVAAMHHPRFGTAACFGSTTLVAVSVRRFPGDSGGAATTALRPVPAPSALPDRSTTAATAQPNQCQSV